MDAADSLTLRSRGKDAWNKWAAQMLSDRRTLVENGDWTKSSRESEWNEATRRWHADARADFSEHHLKDEADFTGYMFPGDARFNKSTFHKAALFSGAIFWGKAEFKQAKFARGAEFQRAEFSDDALFAESYFGHDAAFTEATFTQSANFDVVRFHGIANFNQARFLRATQFEMSNFSRDALFNRSDFSGDVTFSDVAFEGNAEFERSRFSGKAQFGRANFTGKARFVRASFLKGAGFSKSSFSSDARFGGAEFSRPVMFNGSTFSDVAEFNRSIFSGDAGFSQCVFKGLSLFQGALFEKGADFVAIKSESVFTLAGAIFDNVPDFHQAHFSEAPRLDASTIRQRRARQPMHEAIQSWFKGDADLTARWRALKRIAVQGHDHMHELEFFGRELKSRRWSTDRPWHLAFWFGLVYGLVSGFGRSIFRPLFLWAVSPFVIAPLYLCAHFHYRGLSVSSFGWTIDRFVLQPLGAGKAETFHCLVGAGEAWQAALGISARKALLFFGQDASDKLELNYACLFNVVTQHAAPSGKLPSSFHLDVPYSVILLGAAQHIITAVLLFLLLLAIRNHFRIK